MGGTDIYGAGAPEAQLFSLLEQFPLSTVMSILVMVLVAIFFVSGADAASIVMGTLSQNGAIEPRRALVIFWGVATGGVAAVMLLVGGSDALNGLKNITIVSAVPFVLVMVGLCFAFARELVPRPAGRPGDVRRDRGQRRGGAGRRGARRRLPAGGRAGHPRRRRRGRAQRDDPRSTDGHGSGTRVPGS